MMEDEIQTGTDFLGYDIKPNDYVFRLSSGWNGPVLYKINYATPKGINAHLAFEKKKKKSNNKWIASNLILLASSDQVEAYKLKIAEKLLSGD